MLRPYLISLIVTLLLLAACAETPTSEVTLKLQDMQFSQSGIQVKVGQSVTLHLINKDGYAHAFDLDELDIHLQLAAEETTEVTFASAEPGSFTFYCSSPGHQAAGMQGSITVTP
jgi:nitrite reductase (NO-forming)